MADNATDPWKSIKVDPELHEKLQVIARQETRSIVGVIRRAVKAYEKATKR